MNKKSYGIVLGILLILFGIVFLISPTSVFQSIVFAGALVLITFSIIGIIFSLSTKQQLSSSLLISFIVGLVIGAVLLINTEHVIKIFPIFLGIWLFITGLSTLLIMLKNGLAVLSVIYPIGRIILGIICFSIPIIPITFVGIVIGIMLILSGISTITNYKTDEVIYKVKVKK